MSRRQVVSISEIRKCRRCDGIEVSVDRFSTELLMNDAVRGIVKENSIRGAIAKFVGWKSSKEGKKIIKKG